MDLKHMAFAFGGRWSSARAARIGKPADILADKNRIALYAEFAVPAVTQGELALLLDEDTFSPG